MKKVLAIAALFLLTSAFAPKTAFAQGKHDCRWMSVAGGPQACHIFNINCNSEYIPNVMYCSQFSETGDIAGCNAQIGIDCVEKGTATKKVKQKLFCNASGNPTNNPISGKLYTAIGCIPIADTNSFIGFILRWAIGIGGGMAFLLILLAGFMIITSSGNPERLKAGQELLTSAIAGLILLIFSVFILEVIGVDILGLPGFGQ